MRMVLFSFTLLLIGQAEAATLGELEEVELLPIAESSKIILPARVDTGAATSSISAIDYDRRRKYKPGETLRFRTTDKQKKMTWLEAPVTRVGKVRSAHGGSDERVFVQLKICLGERELEAEFSLKDRRTMEFPVLLGRNLLRQGFTVDVAQKKLLGRPRCEPKAAS